MCSALRSKSSPIRYFANDTSIYKVQMKIGDADSEYIMHDFPDYRIKDENGELILYSVISTANYRQNSYAGFEIEDIEVTVPVFRNYGANCWSDNSKQVVYFRLGNYAQYSFLDVPEYECTIDGENWYNSAAINGIGIPYTTPGFYTAQVRCDGNIIYEQRVDTNVRNGYYFETNPFYSTSANRWQTVNSETGEKGHWDWHTGKSYAYEGIGYLRSAMNGINDNCLISPALGPNANGKTFETTDLIFPNTTKYGIIRVEAK